jgi:hypothetical protein
MMHLSRERTIFCMLPIFQKVEGRQVRRKKKKKKKASIHRTDGGPWLVQSGLLQQMMMVEDKAPDIRRYCNEGCDGEVCCTVFEGQDRMF